MSELPKNKVRKRLLIGSCIILICFGFVIYNLYTVQFVDGEMYKKKALSQQLRTASINANRGTIYDRNKSVLAESATVWNVLFSPADITDEEAEILAEGVSEILFVSPDVVLDKAGDKDNFYSVIKRRVDKEVADEVIRFAEENNINGVYLQEDTKRYYRNGSLASSVLGFVNAENKGAYGLEAYFNTVLSGTPGKMVTAKNAKGQDMSFRFQDIYKPQDGDSIVLTLDATVQQIMERHLRTAVIEHGVKNRAAGIFMDITNGEILGMVTMPDFDPNNPNEIADPKTKSLLETMRGESEEAYLEALKQAQYDQWNNKCISEPYEPGSVFKIVTLSAGLDSGAVTPASHFYCPGYHMVGNVKKQCWKTEGHGNQNLAQAVQNSCNPAFMMIGSAIGAHDFYNYFDAFGLTEPTGISLPGEATSIYHSEKALSNPLDYENSLTSCSFGQTFKVTPIQLITAVAAACNGGYLYEPKLIKEVVDSDGNIVSVEKPKLVRQVISEETSKTVCDMLLGVVENGSGRNAYVPGFRVGGKTGTSEKIDLANQTGENEYILSFVGVAPMDDPKYACLVLLDEPSVKNAYGSTIAAPVVGSIFADALPYLGVEKVFTPEEEQNADRTMYSYVGFEPHDAKSKLNKKRLNAKILGDGPRVVSQMPPAGTKLPVDSTVILYTDDSGKDDMVTVPDVRGKSGMIANKLIVNAGLNIRVTGVSTDNAYAVAAHQDVKAGTEVPRGTVVTVDFADRSMANVY